jgi:hypothetical protein
MAIIGIITGVLALVLGVFAMFMAAEAARIADRVKSINAKYGVTKSDEVKPSLNQRQVQHWWKSDRIRPVTKSDITKK